MSVGSFSLQELIDRNILNTFVIYIVFVKCSEKKEDGLFFHETFIQRCKKYFFFQIESICFTDVSNKKKTNVT